MQHLLMIAAKICVLIFVVCVMLGAGARLRLAQILEPLRNRRLVITALIISYVFVPLIAFAIVKLIPLDRPVKIGLMLLGMTAGSEALPKFVERAKANAAFSVGLMFMQLCVTLIYVPAAFLIFMPDAQIEPLKLVLKLVLLVFLPLIIGLFIKSRREALALHIEKVTHRISMTTIVVVFVLFITLNFEEVKAILDWNVAAAIAAFLIASFALGYLAGGQDHGTKVTLGLGSCMRNGSISMVVATQAFGDPRIIVTILLYFIVMIPVLLPIIALSISRAKKIQAPILNRLS